jgi:hypothetical protein
MVVVMVGATRWKFNNWSCCAAVEQCRSELMLDMEKAQKESELRPVAISMGSIVSRKKARKERTSRSFPN